MKISQITRRDLFDTIIVKKVKWAGRLEETDFLSRVFDLTALPSTDSRFSDAEGDIWQHRTSNRYDWDDDWIFNDSRFNLLNCDDDVLLRFLCETIHPVVRANIEEVEKLCELYNQFLKNDGFKLIEKTHISGKPIFVGRYIGVTGTPGISLAREALSGSGVTYVAQQITRMEVAVGTDTSLAIGTAKELIETCCKTILDDRNINYGKSLDIIQLVKLTSKELRLTPDDIEDEAKAAETIKRLLSNLAMITKGVAELRNKYGTGHGKAAKAKGLSPRHAKLAVGAASTLAVFLVETHHTRGN